MKRIALFLGIAAALVTSCSIKVGNFDAPQQDDVVFYASFEQPAVGTRVYVNENLNLRWTADDRVSIFNKITYNQQYKFLGETGDNAGGFNKVDVAEFVTGNPISHIVSVYPYQEGTRISESEVITLTLPAEQHYAENTFGLGANTMVSVSEDNILQYKNVGGFLRISLYGDGVSVSSITLKGNNGEKLAGKASVTMPQDGIPTAVFADDATDRITLVCDAPVALCSTEDESKDFWFVVPPVTFSNGFYITVVQTTGGVFEKSTTKNITIERSDLSKMSPVEVEVSSQPKNVIYYTSSTETVVSPSSSEGFGANIVSNEYKDGRGIITFDGDVTVIGQSAFYNRLNLTSITLPSEVKKIGYCAFYGCSSLTSILIPSGVTLFGDDAFRNCSNLVSIDIPAGLTRISSACFEGCSSLAGITIPDGMVTIGSFAFRDCSSLKSITLPEGITTIGQSAFEGCSGLTSMHIPNTVTGVGTWAFRGCTSLLSFSGKYATQDGQFLVDSGRLLSVAAGALGESVIVPSGVTCIGYGAFHDCSEVLSITLPNTVTSIETSAFQGCSSLTSFTIPDSVASIGGNAFTGCSGLISITIPDNVTVISYGSFSNCSSLISIILPPGVTKIADYAFYYCSALKGLNIPDRVNSIGPAAFKGCSSLAQVNIPSGVTGISRETFYGCSSLSDIIIPDNVTNIYDYAFWCCSGLTEITIPAKVKKIGEYAFYGCSSLTKITALPVSPPTGASSMLVGTNNAPIYVPSLSVEAYKYAQYWSDYASRIQAIL